MELLPYTIIHRVEVQELFTKVFTDSEGEAEGRLIGALVTDIQTKTRDGDLYGYVACDDIGLIGAIFFTRLSFENNPTVFLLSPVAIHTSYQGRGIGQKLIHFGLKALREKEIDAVFTYGDPRFYSQLGFISVSEKVVQAPFVLSQPEGWLGQSLDGDALPALEGKPTCVEAFSRPEIW